MKIPTALFASLLFAMPLHAEQKFPRGTFESKELDKAKAEAAAENKPIAFIYTEKDTTCSLCQGATSAFLDAVKSKAVIVYVESKDKTGVWASLPPNVKKGLGPGKYIPKMVITDASANNQIAAINYDTYKLDDSKAIRELKKALKPAK